MRNRIVAAAALGALVSNAAGDPPLTTVLVVDGLVRPIYVTHAPGDTSRIFIIEKQGRIRIVKNGSLLATPFLDIDSIVGGGNSENSEQGLLGLTFHPNYAQNGLFYVCYTANSDAQGEEDDIVAEFKVTGDPDIADPNSHRQLIRVDEPQANHNGGWIEFGPDGYLYIALGDGGGAGDTNNNAQNINRLLGKMLRIDVNGDDFPGDPNVNYAIPPDNPFVGVDGLDEIWAYGLRNPWRNAFDRDTGDLYIADVGQNAWEEVNFQPASSTGGENYGWRCYEGNHNFNTGGCPPIDETVRPIHEYNHSEGCSITGGYVYRGASLVGLRGTYFFADYCSTTIWSFRYDGSVNEFRNRTAELAPGGGLSIRSITSFGEDARGEMYICDQSGGEVFKIVAKCPGDCDENGVLDIRDFFCFQGLYAAGDPYADCDGNGVRDIRDFFCFQGLFAGGCR